MKFLDAVGPIAISKSVWSQLLDENEKGRSVTSFQDVSLDGSDDNIFGNLDFFRGYSADSRTSLLLVSY